MSDIDQGVMQHLATGATTLARAWQVTRRDGTVMGFTDHDQSLSFEGLTFRAETGLSAMALQQATGLSVDNTEAVGALTDSAIREDDIAAGRYDDAEVVAWLVNWANTDERQILFRGHIGEVTQGGGAFRAELRGLTEGLNRPVGRVFQAPCSAVLGDTHCKFDTSTPGYSWTGAVIESQESRALILPETGAFAPGWFQRGLLKVLSGSAAGLTATVKRDVPDADGRRIELWHALAAPIVAGDQITLVAGCDKRFETCRLKFNNALNFQGFPDIPTEDWVAIHPASGGPKGGGSRR